MQNKINLVYDPAVTMEQLKKNYLILAMDHFAGNKTLAANHLGITIKSLYNCLNRYGLRYKAQSWELGQGDPSVCACNHEPPDDVKIEIRNDNDSQDDSLPHKNGEIE